MNFPVKWTAIDEICDEWGIAKLSEIQLVRFSPNTGDESFAHTIYTNSELDSALAYGNQPLTKYLLPGTITWDRDEMAALSKDQLRRKLGRIGGEFIAYAVTKMSRDTKFSISAFVPYFEADIELALANAQFEAKISDGIVIDADFRTRNMNFDNNAEDFFTYDPKNIDVRGFQKIPSGAVVVPKYEISRPGRILISHTWLSSVLHIASFRSVNVLTAPRISRGKYFPESYLATGLASSIFKIGI
jgi:hypothetical protein